MTIIFPSSEEDLWDSNLYPFGKITKTVLPIPLNEIPPSDVSGTFLYDRICINLFASEDTSTFHGIITENVETKEWWLCIKKLGFDRIDLALDARVYHFMGPYVSFSECVVAIKLLKPHYYEGFSFK